MKDNIREAVFNLIGGYIDGKFAFDLFGGTGAMGLEAISRGANEAVIVERHIPTVRIINENIQTLGLEAVATVASGDTFFWGRQFIKQTDTWPAQPWVVLCCPPYDFYVQRWAELETLIQSMFDAAPQQSVFVVESDDRFDTRQLPQADDWEVRQYAPARVAIYKKGDM
jgi:16S rRNA (guanine966-N2)-methyltransferase